jgi:glutathione synthase/RimK-type ligase-like ATP-grasp enzyme
VIYILRRRGLGRVSCSLIAQHSTTGIEVKRNDQRLKPADTVIRWGTTSRVTTENEINTAEAIHRGADKAGFRKLLMEENLCPKTWSEENEVKFPCIVRPAIHSRAQNLFVCKDKRELRAAIAECGVGWYASELIDKKAEFRIYAAQGRAIGVGEKHPANPEAVAWNMAAGGSCKNVRWDVWPLKVVKAGLAAHKLSGLDFSAIDVIVNQNDNPFVLEVNSSPTLANYRAQAFSKAFDYMIENGKEPLELSTARGGYKKFGHPAIVTGALV